MASGHAGNTRGSGRMSRAVDHVQKIGIDNEWETPQDVYETATKWAGFVPKLDVAATGKTAKCDRYITRRQDALRSKWDCDWWCNPPYSQVMEFVIYGISQARALGTRGIYLTYSKTDTRWWHTWVEDNPFVRVKFIRGRIRFLQDGVEQGPAPYPSVLLRVGH